MVANFSKEELTIPKATVLGVAEEIAEELVNKLNAEDKPKSDLVNQQSKRKERDSVPEATARETRSPIRGGKASDFKGTDVIEQQTVLEDSDRYGNPSNEFLLR
jgi:hypothetical protein